MAKQPISLTIEESNLLWLKGRARVVAGGSVSAAVDQLVAEARAGRLGGSEPARSVVGTIDLAEDPLLAGADAAVRAGFTDSLTRSIGGSLERAPRSTTAASRKKKARG